MPNPKLFTVFIFLSAPAILLVVVFSVECTIGMVESGSALEI